MLPPASESTVSRSNGRAEARKWPGVRPVEQLVHKLELLIGEHPISAAALAITAGVLAAWWVKRK